MFRYWKIYNIIFLNLFLKKMKKHAIIFFLSVSVLIILSFFLYSSRYYPLLNSDDALNILMTYYYKLPQDLYCWGQDRGGTLIPLLSQVFHKLFGISPVNAVSISNYLFLIMGYIGFSSLFKNRYTKIIFALIWFFPPLRFIDLTRFPLGIQYSLLGFSIFLIQKVDFYLGKKFLNHLYTMLIILLLITSVWVSDMAVINISVLCSCLLIFNYSKFNRLKIATPVWGYLGMASVATFLFIKFAKSTARVIAPDYNTFNSFDSFLKAINMLKNAFTSVLTFKTTDLFYSIYAWLVLIFILIIAYCLIQQRKHFTKNMSQWIVFFTLDFFAIIGVLLLSKWVFLNGMGRWYFIPTYISLSIMLLLAFENLSLKFRIKQALSLLLFITVFIGSLSTPHYIKYVRPKSFKPQIDIRAEFLSLGEIGVVAEFWNAYITAAPAPDKIKATSHDYFVRNEALVKEVFEQPNLYIIKDLWLEEFPDTLQQFGRMLIKEGTPFQIGGCNVCKYVWKK